MGNWSACRSQFQSAFRIGPIATLRRMRASFYLAPLSKGALEVSKDLDPSRFQIESIDSCSWPPAALDLLVPSK